jgi:hypothetical protein
MDMGRALGAVSLRIDRGGDLVLVNKDLLPTEFYGESKFIVGGPSAAWSRSG